MATSPLQQKMLDCFVQLNSAEQKSVIQLIKTFIESKEQYTPVTFDEYNRELEEANARIDAGEFVAHEEVMRKYFQ